MEFENQVVDVADESESPEIVEQETEATESEETQEVAAPVEPQKNTSDQAFAQMRRERQALERELKQYKEALGLYFEGDNAVAQAYAHAQQKPVEEITKEFELQAEIERLREENETFQNKELSAQVQLAMMNDLKAIQGIDSTIKSLNDLGDMYFNLISTGRVSAVDAYYAVQAQRQKEKLTAPQEIGKVQKTTQEKDFYSSEEVKNMTQAEVDKNYEKIKKSMLKW